MELLKRIVVNRYMVSTVGGDTLERPWKVLKKGKCKLVTISIVEMPSSEHSLPLYIQKKGASHGVHATWFIVKPNRSQLTRIRDLIDAGDVRPIVDTVLPLSQAQNAYEHPRSHRRGKIVLSVS
jgi:NADPH:quinone reductase-like Zn-dependent oxidoreductase